MFYSVFYYYTYNRTNKHFIVQLNESHSFSFDQNFYMINWMNWCDTTYVLHIKTYIEECLKNIFKRSTILKYQDSNIQSLEIETLIYCQTVEKNCILLTYFSGNMDISANSTNWSQHRSPFQVWWCGKAVCLELQHSGVWGPKKIHNLYSENNL